MLVQSLIGMRIHLHRSMGEGVGTFSQSQHHDVKDVLELSWNKNTPQPWPGLVFCVLTISERSNSTMQSSVSP